MPEDRRLPTRWNLRDAEAEFPIHRETLSKRLISLSETPAADGTFSTKQICAAVFGDREIEKARLAKEQADRIALDNAERRRELIPVEDALIVLRRYCFAIRQKFLATNLSDAEKNEIIGEINRLAAADVSKLPEDEIDAGA